MDKRIASAGWIGGFLVLVPIEMGQTILERWIALSFNEFVGLDELASPGWTIANYAMALIYLGLGFLGWKSIPAPSS